MLDLHLLDDEENVIASFHELNYEEIKKVCDSVEPSSYYVDIYKMGGYSLNKRETFYSLADMMEDIGYMVDFVNIVRGEL